MEYTVFETRFGFFALLTRQGSVIRTVLPQKNEKDALKYLPVGINTRDCLFNPSICPDLQEKIQAYFEGDYKGNFEKTNISFDGLSDFAERVLSACRTIPYGGICSYKRLAEMAGGKNAARAAGSVLAANPVPLIIPCHRIIRSDGKVGGFTAGKAGAVELKRKMLALEGCGLVL